uniref:Uncharacterized protein LOC114339333 n=1 Tax=Diabrotica virgifera virgifera TaxID=50390 RepID=A0A6P7G986_DIAVI
MWHKTVRKWRIDNNGKEITKADVPKVLSDLINEPNMTQNIISGFKISGLNSFDANNVVYSKIIQRQTLTSTNTDTEEVRHHLRFIEAHIEPSILAQFKDAKTKNCCMTSGYD